MNETKDSFPAQLENLRVRVAELEAERGRLSNDARQGLANERALHDALFWAHEWHLRELPSPSRVTQAAIERIADLEAQVAAARRVAERLADDTFDGDGATAAAGTQVLGAMDEAKNE